MDNLDETIIKLKNEQRKRENTHIESGVYIKDIWTEFHVVEVLDNKLTLLIPTSFVNMPAAVAKVKYPSEQRPQCIKTSLDTSVNMAISLFNLRMDGKHPEGEAAMLRQVLRKTNPAMEFYKTGVEELEDFTLAWFDYRSHAIDQQVYNIMFTASLQGKMLHGAFNCPYADYHEWHDPALQMIGSIKVNKRKTQDENK